MSRYAIDQTTIPARFTSSAAPGPSDRGILTGPFAQLTTAIDYEGSVTAATIQSWKRVMGKWYKAASTDDLGPLDPVANSEGESRDWAFGRDAEIWFQLASISPGTSGNTVAVDVIGIDL